MSLFNLESSDKKPTILDHPFSLSQIGIDIVGCCNGLVCISIPPFPVIVLWNPAMMLSKSLSLLEDCGVHKRVSLGFGYDAVGCDFKVVRIVCLENRTEGGESLDVHGVEVYSVNSDPWITINPGFKFSVSWNKNDAIVNGSPYWIAKVDENESAKNHFGQVLVCFDMKKLVFQIVPLSSFNLNVWEAAIVPLVYWKGSLGALLYTMENDERVESLDVWVFDDGEQIWRKNHTFRPIEMKRGWALQCSKNGKIMGERPDGQLFVFDSDTGCIKVCGTQTWPIEIHQYTESLAYIKGMKPQQEGEKEEDDSWQGLLTIEDVLEVLKP